MATRSNHSGTSSDRGDEDQGNQGVWQAQPPADLDADDTEGIVDAFLLNASQLGMDEASVNVLLEEIFPQAEEDAGAEPHPSNARGGSVLITTNPFHGTKGPIGGGGDRGRRRS